jgi:hypothetical protein
MQFLGKFGANRRIFKLSDDFSNLIREKSLIWRQRDKMKIASAQYLMPLVCPTEEDLGMLLLSVCIVMLYWREDGEWGRVQSGGGFWNEAVDSEQGTSKDRDLQLCTKSRHSKEGGFSSKQSFMYLIILTCNVCVQYKEKHSFCAC